MGAMNVSDAYQALGQKPGCSDEELKKAFRKVALQYHPDRNQGDKQAEERFKEINEAYDLLTNPERKEEREGRARFTGFGTGGVTDDIFSAWKAKVDAEAASGQTNRNRGQRGARTATPPSSMSEEADPADLKAGYDLSEEIAHRYLRSGDTRTVDGVVYTYLRVVYRSNGVLTRTLVLCSGNGVIARMEIVPGQGLRPATNGELVHFRTKFEQIKAEFGLLNSQRATTNRHIEEFAEWLEKTDSIGDAREYVFKQVPFATETRPLLCKGNEVLQISTGEPKEGSGFRYASAETCSEFNNNYFRLREQVQRRARSHGKSMPSLSWADRMRLKADKILRDLGG